MYWNYRVMRTIEEEDVVLSIVEVYYEDDGKLVGYTDPVNVSTTDGDLHSILEKMRDALSKTPLTPEDFGLTTEVEVPHEDDKDLLNFLATPDHA